ncbi:MAG: hypothetical protein AAGB32_06285, partial [Pseudomonadota bacterium]
VRPARVMRGPSAMVAGTPWGTTLSESIFDRQEDGSFRLTQRFTDENGETNTNIQFNVLPPDTDVALGNTPQISRTGNDPFQILRGNEIDLSA